MNIISKNHSQCVPFQIEHRLTCINRIDVTGFQRLLHVKARMCFENLDETQTSVAWTTVYGKSRSMKVTHGKNNVIFKYTWHVS